MPPDAAEPPSSETTIAAEQFAEEFAVGFEATMPRMAGRILGTLLIAEEPFLTATELGNRLGASSASISNMTRLLLRMRLIERLVRVDTRRDAYRIRPDAWVQVYRESFDTFAYLVTLLDRTLASVPENAATRDLRETRDFFAFVRAELPKIVERYEETRTRRQP